MAIPTENEVFNALNSLPEFTDKVFPVVQAVDEDKDIELPSLIYIPAGTEYDNYLDGGLDQVSASYRCIVYEKIRKELPVHEKSILAALVSRFNVLDFRALEDSYVGEDGDIFIRPLQFVLGR